MGPPLGLNPQDFNSQHKVRDLVLSIFTLTPVSDIIRHINIVCHAKIQAASNTNAMRMRHLSWAIVKCIPGVGLLAALIQRVTQVALRALLPTQHTQDLYKTDPLLKEPSHSDRSSVHDNDAFLEPEQIDHDANDDED